MWYWYSFYNFIGVVALSAFGIIIAGLVVKKNFKMKSFWLLSQFKESDERKKKI